MQSTYHIYERKDYFNRFRLTKSVSFRIGVRETNLRIQARSDLSGKAKDAVFRYRYQIEEYLRQHPAFRETSAPIEIYASAPEIVRFSDLSCRATGAPPMACISGAMADFVARDLASDSADLVVASGGDASVRCSGGLDAYLYAEGSPLHEKLVLDLPSFDHPYGISTFVPGRGIHAVTVLSRCAAWASAFARDIGTRLARGEHASSVLDRVESYTEVGGLVLIAGNRVVVGGDLRLRSANGSGDRLAAEERAG